VDLASWPCAQKSQSSRATLRPTECSKTAVNLHTFTFFYLSTYFYQFIRCKQKCALHKHVGQYTQINVEPAHDNEGKFPATRGARQLLTGEQFMQRSAAKNVASSPTATPSGPASKKVRLSNGGSVASDHQILQSALAEEAKKQQEAVDKAALHTGETKWVLSYTDPLEGKRGDALDVRRAGFAELDAEDSDEEDEEEAQPIRRQYGGGVKKADVRWMQVLV
jgi:hypothetical protein